jgi:predicted transposase/invertase (TIGR01784 family)
VSDRLLVKTDFMFQRIFGRNENKELCIDFLNAMLNLPSGQKLTDLDIFENTRLLKKSAKAQVIPATI